jgi:hypothetical protein
MYKERRKLVIGLLISLLLAGCRIGLPSEAAITPSPTTQSPLNTPTQSQINTKTGTPFGECSSTQAWTIEFRREGGIMGLSQQLKVTSDGNAQVEDLLTGKSFARRLDPSQILEVQNALVQACPFETPKKTQTCADCFAYSMSIQMDEELFHVQVSDVSVPQDMQPLIQFLSSLLQQMIVQ